MQDGWFAVMEKESRCGMHGMRRRQKDTGCRLPMKKEYFSSYGELEPGMLLPKECTADENVVSFIMPIHYQEHFFGYCIIGHCDMVTEADLIKQWMLELGNAVESVLKKQILQT